MERIIRRLLDKEYPIDITELLVVTFTKAAAAEMRDRIGTALMKALSETKDPRVERQLALLPSAQISTLHAFCQHVIRKYFYTIDLDPAFSIAGEEELNLLRRQVLKTSSCLTMKTMRKRPSSIRWPICLAATAAMISSWIQ